MLNNCRPYKLYCVGGDVKPCSINRYVEHQIVYHVCSISAQIWKMFMDEQFTRTTVVSLCQFSLYRELFFCLDKCSHSFSSSHQQLQWSSTFWIVTARLPILLQGHCCFLINTLSSIFHVILLVFVALSDCWVVTHYLCMSCFCIFTLWFWTITCSCHLLYAWMGAAVAVWAALIKLSFLPVKMVIFSYSGSLYYLAKTVAEPFGWA